MSPAAIVRWIRDRIDSVRARVEEADRRERDRHPFGPAPYPLTEEEWYDAQVALRADEWDRATETRPSRD